MRVTAASVTFTVPDVGEAARFLRDHFGLALAMEAPGFAALAREDLGVTVTLMQAGSPVLPPQIRDRSVQGAVLALVVEGIEAEEARLRAARVPFLMDLHDEAWGERLLMVEGPGGLVVELVDAASVHAA